MTPARECLEDCIRILTGHTDVPTRPEPKARVVNEILGRLAALREALVCGDEDGMVSTFGSRFETVKYGDYCNMDTWEVLSDVLDPRTSVDIRNTTRLRRDRVDFYMSMAQFLQAFAWNPAMQNASSALWRAFVCK